MDSLINKTIDSYLILEVIGRGGMGVVYKALDTHLDKYVALKMIDPFLAKDASFVRRFKTEAKALAKLENNNIVIVHAFRETSSGLFMVMEYVDAKPLSDYLRNNGAFKIADTTAILKQLLNAIGHAHQVGVIHRDIKPSNILLSENGKIKVTDFGLAKVIQQSIPTSTISQTIAGTLYYMSPEQVKGLKNVDKRSDLYSLGMTFYEMLIGRLPFERTDSHYTIQKQIVEGEIASPLKFNPFLSLKLLKIILKAINTEPNKRYQTAEEMLDDIDKFEREIQNEKRSELNDKEKTSKYIGPIRSKLKIGKPEKIILLIIFGLLVALFYLISSTDKVFYDSSYISVLTSPDNAEIFFDDYSIGLSPLENHVINFSGDVKLRIMKEGFLSIDTIFFNQLGSNDTLKFNLTAIIPDLITPRKISAAKINNAAAFRQLRIITSPPNANVFLDEIFVGLTPYECDTLKLGEYRLSISKKGYKNHSELIKIEPNKVLALAKELTAVTSLTIKSDPLEAEVFINNRLVGKTPYADSSIKLGEYIISIKKTGFRTYTRKISIIDNLSVIELNPKLEMMRE